MKLYSLNQKASEIDDLLEESQGEITPEIETAMQVYETNKTALFVDLANIREEWKMRETALKEMKKEIDEKIKKSQKAQEAMKQLILSGMDSIGQKKIQTPTVKISVVKGRPSVNVQSIEKIPNNYKKVTLTVTADDAEMVKAFGINIIKEAIEADKTKILALYKENQIEVDGTSIKETPSLRIS